MKYFALILLGISLSACELSSEAIQNAKQEAASKYAVATVGFPSIINFQEKRTLKMILELRDSEKLITHTYITDMNGHLHKLCTSLGYGIPYATQYTSPQKSKYFGDANPMPQADPNGLYSPSSADGTWVLCRNPSTGKPEPVYVEPKIITSPFELSIY